MLPSTVRVYVAAGTTDLRRSIDGLAMLVRERLALDPSPGISSCLSGSRAAAFCRFADNVGP